MSLSPHVLAAPSRTSYEVLASYDFKGTTLSYMKVEPHTGSWAGKQQLFASKLRKIFDH